MTPINRSRLWVQEIPHGRVETVNEGIMAVHGKAAAAE